MAASLLLALLSWFLVTVREKIEVGYLVPLVFEGIPANLRLDGSPLGSVYVRLQGSRQTVEHLLPQQLQARVDLSAAVPGNNIVQISPQMVTLPRGVTLVGISPSYLDLRFLSQAAVPVHVRTVGEPAPGHAVARAYAVPAEVAVVGRPEHVERVRRVEAAAVRVDGRRDLFRERATFVLPSNQVRLLELQPTEIVVEIVPTEPDPGAGPRRGTPPPRHTGALEERHDQDHVRHRRHPGQGQPRPDDLRDRPAPRPRLRLPVPRRRAPPPDRHRQGHAAVRLHARERARRRHLLDGRGRHARRAAADARASPS